MIDLSDIVALSKANIADYQFAYRNGDLDICDVTRFFLDRIAQFNPALHAVIAINPLATQVAEEQMSRLALAGC